MVMRHLRPSAMAHTVAGGHAVLAGAGLATRRAGLAHALDEQELASALLILCARRWFKSSRLRKMPGVETGLLLDQCGEARGFGQRARAARAQ